jgi:hypothetical protein
MGRRRCSASAAAPCVSGARGRRAQEPAVRHARPWNPHRVIAAPQKTILASGMLAVGPSPKHGKSDGIAARARAKRARGA